jgi:hypothetical protein
MKARNITKTALLAWIGGCAIAKKLEIARKDFTPFMNDFWTNLGLDPKEMANGTKTTKLMEIYGPEFGYTFVSDGRTKGGNHISPRLVRN